YNIMAQTLRALDFIHRAGILHNDLKPANILLAKGDNNVESLIGGHKGDVKLIDFGLISRENTAWNKILGTLRYISPERILRREADRRSDLYSIGIMFYVLLARRAPYTAKAPKELLKQHLEMEPPSLASLRPDLPSGVVALVHKLMEKAPKNRFQTGAEALAFLGEKLGWEETEVSSSSASWAGGRLTAGALIHRDTEVGLYKSLYEKAATGKPNALIVEGPGGVGKSRLVDDLRGAVQTSGGSFVEVSCRGIGSTLQPVVDALIASYQTSGVRGLDSLQSKLDSAVNGGTDLGDALEKSILWAAKTSPILLHFDDFDQAPRSIYQLALELLHSACSEENTESPKLLVVVSRNSDSSQGRIPLSSVPSVELKNFTKSQGADFLRQAFGQKDIPEGVVSNLYQASDGNPLLLLELANQLVSGGDVSFSGSTWTFPEDLSGIELPDSVDQLLSGRVRKLSTDEIEAIEWIAASGRPLSFAVLDRCSRKSGTELRAIVRGLTESGLVEKRGDDTEEDSYRLSHMKTGEILLAELGDEKIQRLHQRIAQNTEEQNPDWSHLADVLAEHWLETGNEAGFLRFAPDAAELIRARGDYATAVRYHERIVDSMPETAVAKKIQSLAKLSEMHEFLWDLESCVNDLKRMQELGGRLMKPVDQALIKRRAGCVELSRHRFPEARTQLEEALEGLGSAPEIYQLSVKAALALTIALGFDPEKGRKLAVATEARLIAMGVPEGSDRERMLYLGAANHTASALHYMGKLQSAARLFETNLKVLESLNQEQALGATHCTLGSVYFDSGDFDDAFKHLREAQRIGKETGDRRTLCRARERLGEYFLRFGRYREALQTSQVGCDDAESIGNQAALSNSLRTLGRIYITADHQELAGKTLTRAVAESKRCGDPIAQALSRLERAKHALIREELEEARSEIEKLRTGAAATIPFISAQRDVVDFVTKWHETGTADDKLIEGAREVFVTGGYRSQLADLFLAETDVRIREENIDAAKTALGALKEITENLTTPDVRCEAGWLRARLLQMAGKAEKASTLYLRVQELARSLSDHRIVRLCNERNCVPA
ncbi:MAG: tetratricopeptide repeat protein, partial [Planctomycetota bacterium]